MNKNIALVTYTLSYGGVGKSILILAEGLKKKGYSVTLITTDRKGSWYNECKNIGIESKSFNSSFFEWIPFGRLIHALRLLSFVKKKRFDLIINNHSYYCNIIAHSFPSQTKYICVIHNQLPKMVEQQMNPNADTLVCVSKKIEKLVIEMGGDPKSTTCILNGMSTSMKELSLERKEKDDTFKILYVGRLDQHQKAILSIPKIIKELINKGLKLKVSIVGDGPDKAILADRIKELDLQNIISFKGLVPMEEVYSYYLSHDVFLLPSRYEGLPLTLTEAMNFGCVPVVSLLPDSTDIVVDDGVNGYLVPPSDLNLFINRIESLIQDSSLWKKMSLAATDKSEKYFSKKQFVEEYHSIFQQIIETPKTEKLKKRPSLWKDIFPYAWIYIGKKYFFPYLKRARK